MKMYHRNTVTEKQPNMFQIQNHSLLPVFPLV